MADPGLTRLNYDWSDLAKLLEQLCNIAQTH